MPSIAHLVLQTIIWHFTGWSIGALLVFISINEDQRKATKEDRVRCIHEATVGSGPSFVRSRAAPAVESPRAVTL